MAYRSKLKRAGKGLVKYGGRVVTAGHAAKCVAKGFKGCSNREIVAVVRTIERIAAAAKRRNS